MSDADTDDGHANARDAAQWMSGRTRQDGVHPHGEYSRRAKWFHWTTVPFIALLLATGLTIRFIAEQWKMQFYTLHESVGLLVLTLSVARLTWRLRHPPPEAAHLPAFERAGAEAAHKGLYAALIVQPVLGFFTTNAYGFPQRDATAFLGFINLPRFMEPAPDLARTLHWAHSLVGWALVPLLVLHIGAVLFHHAGKRDGTLLRML